MKLRNILFSLAVAAASLTGCSKEERGFVAVENGEFVRDGKTMTFTTQMNPDANTNPTAAFGDISYLPTYLYYENKFN